MIKPISISLSPNTEKDDYRLAFKMLLSPGQWKEGSQDGRCQQRLEKEFREYLGLAHSFSFNSGRSSLMAILKALALPAGSQILLQAFTCNAAVNPIIWSGLKPVFVDCDEKTFNLCPDDLKKKINSDCRAVIVQHTFGLPAELDEIIKICREHDLILIEDCAHSLGARYRGRKVGTFGRVSFFSFSRDKIISSIYGGLVATDDEKIASRLKEIQADYAYPSAAWTMQQLLHPWLMNWLILPTYSIVGKYLLVFLQQIRALSKAVHYKEKKGRQPSYFPKKMPAALACLALNQFKKMEKFNTHRQKIAAFYRQKLAHLPFCLPIDQEQAYLRFSLKHEKAREIIRQAWQKNILIGDWYDRPIGPYDTRLDKMQYLPGSCPTAEYLSKITFNLPTHINISEKEAKKIVDFLKNLKHY